MDATVASAWHGTSREASVLVYFFDQIHMYHVYGCMVTTCHPKSVCPIISALELKMPLKCRLHSISQPHHAGQSSVDNPRIVTGTDAKKHLPSARPNGIVRCHSAGVTGWEMDSLRQWIHFKIFKGKNI